MTDDDLVLDVVNVTKTYRLYQRNLDRLREVFNPFSRQYHQPFHALRDISFQVKKGESLGIIGRNGSGKSTLLQILCSIIRPTAGKLEVKGRVSALLELGAGFNPEFTGRENVYMNGSILGFSTEEIDGKIDEIAAFAEIGDFIDQPVKMYSSGMYVRLAFATAISVDPELLVVDEALAVGDIFFQQKCIRHMKEVMANCTIIFVTHDMHIVTNLCERVIVLDGGKKIFEGSPLDGVSRYTKLIHSESRRQQSDNSGNHLHSGSKNIDTVKSAIDKENGRERWKVVPEASKGGANGIDIVKVRAIGEDFCAKQTVEPGETIIVQMMVETADPLDKLIFGYTVKDRIGNAIFGENTCSSLNKDLWLDSGRHIVELRFNWPEIYPDTYTFTFGVGQGDDPFVHVVHCWAHNILSIVALNHGQGVHGIFNNKISACTIEPISADGFLE
jgi:ABC-type polysaccharide/polyol phosphate transport system ATPase subunit